MQTLKVINRAHVMIMRLNRRAKLYLKLGDVKSMRTCQDRIDIILNKYIGVGITTTTLVDTTPPVVDRPAYRSVHHESLLDDYIGF